MKNMSGIINFLDYGTLRVTSKERYENPSPYVYDIEVKDNHNFILGGIKKNW